MKTVADLQGWFTDAGRVLLGFSGGVDSSVLAVVGHRSLGADFLAVVGRSASLPADQAAMVAGIAADFGVPLEVVGTGELDDPHYRANAPDRCYFCKQELWQRLGDVAAGRGFTTIIDGTNLDDLGDHRPGAAAAREHRIRSPFLELGWSKDEVRAAGRVLGLPNWAAPAAPCLASRIRYGLEVTADRLKQVEHGEQFLRSLGVDGDLRVRHLGSAASIEVAPGRDGLVADRWPEVEAAFAAFGFAEVRLDPRGYRRGSLLPVAS